MARRVSALALSLIAALALGATAVPVLTSAGSVPEPAVELSEVLRRHGPGAPVLMVAHRGYWRGAPENSLDGIEQAVEHGAQVVEIDVQGTADGELVLMHDESVDRTTDGTGVVAALTMEQIGALRLKAGLGGALAPVTAARVPTLREAILATRGRALINLDRAWPFRDQILGLLTELDAVDQALFKSTAPVAEVSEFLARDPRILYSHVVYPWNVGHVGAFTKNKPLAYELNFERLTDATIQPAVVARARATSRIWVNTMWDGLAAGFTDEASLRDPALGWAAVIDRYGASMIQTDNVDKLRDWLADPAALDVPAGTVRVQAESGGNPRGARAAVDPSSGGYESADGAGTLGVAVTRSGGLLRYAVDVPEAGEYQVTARVSSPYRPAGRFTVDLGADGVTAPVDVVTTTSHGAFVEQVVEESRRLARGRHEVVVRVDPVAYQNFTLDYLEFSRLRAR
ncbi:glycerophosphodiester phosphodiesterase family protein [Actinoplanes sp. NPDC051494]|uniref:glycerophosphodiester phosphodiesterase family protein n=1 Tax=Actinoplanes sp. NPDC051494 TaxID=3363907 RepID=UPI0037BC8DF4